jgi:hypothetical protein
MSLQVLLIQTVIYLLQIAIVTRALILFLLDDQITLPKQPERPIKTR